MSEKDFCKYVDVFLGNGETDRFFEDGPASKWFYIKALCGNTVPHAVLPFGKMSVGAYSGGYPTGYGMHYPNSCGGIKKLGDVHKIKGFSHLHHSGTGAIGYYYNYAITSPFYGDISLAQEAHVPENERACPGYYSAEIPDVFCEMTVDGGGVAYHRYTFNKNNGRVAIDFSNDGLSEVFDNRFHAEVKSPDMEITDGGVSFYGEFSGIPLYFFAKAEGKNVKVSLYEGEAETDLTAVKPKARPYGAVFDFSGRETLIKISYSTVSAKCAKDTVMAASADFNGVKAKAEEIWNGHLSAIRIETEDERLKKKFYSNLYHSLIKPVDMTGERILGVAGDTVSDLATFWDQYKTVFPLIYMCYPEMGEKTVRGIVNVSRTLGKIPCSFGLTNIFSCEEQAKMLGVISLCDAYYFGVPSATPDVIKECAERELAREDYTEFLKSGYFERYTHILDVTDACLAVAEITDDGELRERLIGLSEFWKNAYGEDGLMSEASPYYEGDRYTYSFRLQKNMEERVALAGGRDRFSRLLDDFFGVNGESVKQLTYVGAGAEIAKKQYHRFEGFNNECDMETPYAYIYADRHDRLCEIIHECVTRSFGEGTGGIPGNNDSGGLSSLLLWNMLGIFPATGSGELLIGSPHIDSAEISLLGGNVLKISVSRHGNEQIYVDRVLWNGEEIRGYKIPVRQIMRGGELKFFMK